MEVVNNNDKHPYFDPITQRESVPESAKIGFVVHTLRAEDHEVGRENALTYAITEPITAIDNNGKLVNHTEEFKVSYISFKRNLNCRMSHSRRVFREQHPCHIFF